MLLCASREMYIATDLKDKLKNACWALCVYCIACTHIHIHSENVNPHVFKCISHGLTVWVGGVGESEEVCSWCSMKRISQSRQRGDWRVVHSVCLCNTLDTAILKTHIYFPRLITNQSLNLHTSFELEYWLMSVVWTSCPQTANSKWFWTGNVQIWVEQGTGISCHAVLLSCAPFSGVFIWGPLCSLVSEEAHATRWLHLPANFSLFTV